MKIFILALLLFSHTVYAQVDETCFKFNLSAKRIEDYLCKETRVVIPNVISNVKVVKIGHGSFYSKNLESVIIPSTVTDIQSQAFFGNNLKELSLPSSVKFIGENAFQENDLEYVDLGDEVISVGYMAFNSNKIRFLKLSESLELIDDFAFRSNKIQSLILPNNLKIIGDQAFSHNQIKGKLYIPKSTVRLGVGAFSGNQITSVRLPKRISDINGAFFNNKISEISIPKNITHISKPFFMRQRDPATGKFDYLSRICLSDNVTFMNDTSNDDYISAFIHYYNVTGSKSGCFEYKDEAWFKSSRLYYTE